MRAPPRAGLLALALQVACLPDPRETPPEASQSAVPTQQCGSQTVDITTSAAHCGRCNNPCTRGTTCREGSCACEGELWWCGACIDVRSDPRNCGACGVSCGSVACRDGRCVCGDKAWCSDRCVDLQVDRAHCGACGAACPAESPGCAAGVCACPAARPSTCGGACVDTRSSPAHCGGCNRSCGGRCVGGVCIGRPKSPAAGDRLGTRRPTFRWEGDGEVAVDVCADLACASVVASFAGTAVRGVTATSDLAPGVYFWRLRPTGVDAGGGRRGGTFRIDRRATTRAGLLPPAPDLNGDGLADVIVSARRAVTVYFGARGAVATTPARVLTVANATNAGALALVGDLLAEAELDAAVTGPSRWQYIVAAATAEGLTLQDSGNYLAAPVLDLDDDGAPDWGQETTGPAIWYGTPGSLDRSSRTSHIGVATGIEQYAPAGDVDGDGRPDVLLASTTGQRAWVGLGASTGVDRFLALPPAPRTGGYGATLACAGDVNGDGFADALVGLGATGAAVYLGGRDALTFHRVIDAPAGHDVLVAAAGDVDGDGFGDVIAVPRASGSAWLYRGSAAGLAAAPTAARDPRWLAVESIGLPGDRDGDGLDDVVVGAPSTDTVYVFFGASSAPLSRALTLSGEAGSDAGRHVL